MSEVDAKTKGEFANWVLPQATGHLMEEIETLRSKLSASEEAREQAQIERDNWQADYRTMYGNRDYWKVRAKDAEERAEKAEAQSEERTHMAEENLAVAIDWIKGLTTYGDICLESDKKAILAALKKGGTNA